MMNRIAKIFQTDKSKKPTGPYLTGMTDSDTLGSSEPVTAASISATDTIPSVLVSAATANDQGTHTGSVTVSVQLLVVRIQSFSHHRRLGTWTPSCRF